MKMWQVGLQREREREMDSEAFTSVTAAAQHDAAEQSRMLPTRGGQVLPHSRQAGRSLCHAHAWRVLRRGRVVASAATVIGVAAVGAGGAIGGVVAWRGQRSREEVGWSEQAESSRQGAVCGGGAAAAAHGSKLPATAEL